MIFEKVDLYEYFGLRRKSNEKGILTVYARPLHGEEPQDKRRPACWFCPAVATSLFPPVKGNALRWSGYNVATMLLCLTIPFHQTATPCNLSRRQWRCCT